MSITTITTSTHKDFRATIAQIANAEKLIDTEFKKPTNKSSILAQKVAQNIRLIVNSDAKSAENPSGLTEHEIDTIYKYVAWQTYSHFENGHLTGGLDESGISGNSTRHFTADQFANIIKETAANIKRGMPKNESLSDNNIKVIINNLHSNISDMDRQKVIDRVTTQWLGSTSPLKSAAEREAGAIKSYVATQIDPTTGKCYLNDFIDAEQFFKMLMTMIATVEQSLQKNGTPKLSSYYYDNDHLTPDGVTLVGAFICEKMDMKEKQALGWTVFPSSDEILKGAIANFFRDPNDIMAYLYHSNPRAIRDSDIAAGAALTPVLNKIKHDLCPHPCPKISSNNPLSDAEMASTNKYAQAYQVPVNLLRKLVVEVDKKTGGHMSGKAIQALAEQLQSAQSEGENLGSIDQLGPESLKLIQEFSTPQEVPTPKLPQEESEAIKQYAQKFGIHKGLLRTMVMDVDAGRKGPMSDQEISNLAESISRDM